MTGFAHVVPRHGLANALRYDTYVTAICGFCGPPWEVTAVRKIDAERNTPPCIICHAMLDQLRRVSEN